MTKKTTEELEDIEVAEDGIEEPEVIDPPEIDSKYRLILLAAQRSKQLQRGAHPRVDLDLRKRKPTRVALKELEEKKVHFELLED
ncbi:MAG: DNA-directed RNA polymerase subunit omega [Acidobacteria bacterium]|nr:DNA-directed RNA polymerase subunit omega [Acidobacteriota bacterium]